MINFSEYIVEDKKKPEGFHVFDMDDTLVYHDGHKLRVHVLGPSGNRVKTLTNQEYNTHKLPANHTYDFNEFRSSEIFAQSAKPIHSMISKLKSINKRGGKTAILTARSDLDDKDKFAHHMLKHGIDIDKTHVYRAGNIEGQAADTKALIMHDLLNKHGHKKVHLYDDCLENLDKFLKLKKHFPETEFHAHHINHDSKTGKVKISTTSLTEKPSDKEKAKK